MADPGNEYCRVLRVLRDAARETSGALLAEGGLLANPQECMSKIEDGITAAESMLNDPASRYYTSAATMSGWMAVDDSSNDTFTIANELCVSLTVIWRAECEGAAIDRTEIDTVANAQIWQSVQRFETLLDRIGSLHA